MRKIEFNLNFIEREQGSVLVSYGNTKVICSATIINTVPPFLRNSLSGWLSAEYSMLPSATVVRNAREAVKGKQQGRTVEIQRLIGRSLRRALDLEKLTGKTILVDCDVIQADGGSRTASITGGYVAVVMAIKNALNRCDIELNPIISQVAAVSVGVVNREIIVDMNYEQDCSADSDINLVLDSSHNFIEIQGSAERNTFSEGELLEMMSRGKDAIIEIMKIQKEVLSRT